ncbi:MAG: type VI secretion system baseplate subunit TssK [Terriglobales bacterium]
MASVAGAAKAGDVQASAGERTSVPEAIQWHEGMLLSPQHFQQLSARWEGLLQQTALGLNPFAWGVRRLQTDPAVLPAGRFRVRLLEAVLPDGEAVSFDASEEAESEALELDLAAAAEAHPGPQLTIYIAAPLRTAEAAHGELARFRSVAGGPVVDENTGEGGMPLARLRVRLSLFAGEPPPARYVWMPLARVERREDAFVLSDYVAPRLQVDFDCPLYAPCAAIAELLRAKALHLAEQVRSPTIAGQGAAAWECKRQIQCLVSALPAFEALLLTGRAHPFGLYLALCDVAGAVTGLAASLQPPLLGAYRHEELAGAFATVREFILRAVREGVADAYLTIPLERNGAGAFYTLMDASWAERRLVLGIRRPAGASEADMAGWAEQSLIASEGAMAELRAKRTLGLRRRQIGAGDELVAPAGVVLFELTRSAALLLPGQRLLVENPGAAAAPAEVLLYVKQPQA